MKTVRLTPSEYAKHAVFGFDFAACSQIEVNGNLRLTEIHGMRSLPKARVTGSVVVEECPDLESCHLSASGFLEVHQCFALERISGTVGSAVLDGTALASIGADFECQGMCTIVNSLRLRRLNCAIGGILVTDRVGKILTGPAFSCQSGTLSPPPGRIASLHAPFTPPSVPKTNPRRRER